MEYVNTTDHGVLVDKDGHTMDGHTRAELDDTPQVRRAVEQGFLLRLDDDTDEGSEDEQADEGTISSSSAKKSPAKKAAKDEEGSK